MVDLAAVVIRLWVSEACTTIHLTVGARFLIL